MCYIDNDVNDVDDVCRGGNECMGDSTDWGSFVPQSKRINICTFSAQHNELSAASES